MPRIRIMLAGFLLAASALIGTSGVNAAPIATPLSRTDFTLVTPNSALLYLTLQGTSPRQAKDYARIVARLLGQQGLQRLLGTLLGGQGSGTSVAQGPGTTANQGAATAGAQGGAMMAPQIFSLLSGTLGKIFSGELGLALLPSTAAGGNRVHLLLEAGLQPGINGVQLQFAASLLGLGGAPQQPYRGLGVVRVDLNALLRGAGAIFGNAAMGASTLIGPNGAISSVFYGAVAGTDAVLATDLPTLKAAIDTYSGARRSIGATDSYEATVGILPGERFSLIYAHLGGDAIRQVVGAVAGTTAAALVPGGSGTLTLGTSLTVQPDDKILFAISTPQGVLGATLPITI